MKPAKLKKWIVADCETDPFAHGQRVAPFIWGSYDGTDYREFDTTAGFVEYLRNFDGICYMHNGGKFDALFLVPWIRGPVLMINNRLASCHVGLCNVRDSYCILPVALAAYRKDDFDYDLLKSECRADNMDQIRHYLKNDCVYLHEFVGRFISEYGQPMTLASAAMDVWGRKYSPPISYLTGKQGKRWYDAFSNYYVGGRTQCFIVGEVKTSFSVYDINSAYPFAMCGRIPWGFKTATGRAIIDKDIDLGFFDIEGFSRGAFCENGAYPHKYGKFCVTGHELRAALVLGLVDIHKVWRAIYFRDSVTFEDYVGCYFQKKVACKNSGDRAGELIAKFFLNSLYGKFGANPQAYSEASIIEAAEVRRMALDGYSISPIGDGIYAATTPLPEKKWRWFNVATAAGITGAVRAMLLYAVTRSKGVAYCDTDSIAAETVVVDAGPKLGQWKLEATCDYAAIAGKKMYAMHYDGKPKSDSAANWKVASKGVRLKPSEIVRVARGETIEFSKESPSFSLKGGQRFITRRIVATG